MFKHYETMIYCFYSNFMHINIIDARAVWTQHTFPASASKKLKLTFLYRDTVSLLQQNDIQTTSRYLFYVEMYI